MSSGIVDFLNINLWAGNDYAIRVTERLGLEAGRVRCNPTRWRRYSVSRRR